MKKGFCFLLCTIIMLACLAACGTNPQTPPETTADPSETVTPTPEATPSAEPTAEPEPSPKTSAQPVQSSGNAFKLELDDNSRHWAMNSVPDIYLTIYYPEYIFEGDEDYPPKFITFTPVENTIPTRLESDRAIFYGVDSPISYDYSIMKSMNYDVFLERAGDASNIIKDGSDGIAMFKNAEDDYVNALVDISEQFGESVQLKLLMFSEGSNSRLTIDDLAALCEAEIERVLSSMQTVTLSTYWSQGLISSVDLFDYYEDYLVTVDTSSLAPVSIQNLGITYFKFSDNEAIEYEIRFYTYMDDTVEKTLPDGTIYYERATEYGTYRYFPIEAEDELYIRISSSETGAAFEAEAERAYSLITIK